MSRCMNPAVCMERGMFCGLPEGHEEPHRFIEFGLADRLEHEWLMLRHGYTNHWEFALAVIGYPKPLRFEVLP